MRETMARLAVSLAWLIPALPLSAAGLVFLLGELVSPFRAGLLATLSVFVSAALSGLLALHPAHAAYAADWLPLAPGLVIRMGVLIDPLSVLLLVVVTSVSLLVHVYSLGYMKGEPGFARYFAFLNLFTGAMLGLVVSTNLIQTYVFWELVGASSFLLIGFHYDRSSAAAAAKKAFIVTRFADLGFLVGILLLAYFAAVRLGLADPFEFQTLTSIHALDALRAAPPLARGVGVLPVAALLLFMGAAGKSAMFPLHIWLPDAMEGPTPVSALIHAATMVVAGVYLVARLFPLFVAAGPALEVVSDVGAFTCVFAALIACAQDDIKRVLAYSTLSQIGYMMLSMGLGPTGLKFEASGSAGYDASLFHLMTHAFFKALLFLGAGSLIHAAGTNDLRKMGGLARRMPITHATFLVAVLSIAGIPPFAGFFSKDAILGAAWASGRMGIFAAALAVAGLTAFYMARVYFLAFWGRARGGHAHESPLVMTVPLILLSVASLVSGFLGPEGTEHAIATAALLLALAGIAAAWRLFGTILGGVPDRAWYRLLRDKFYVDEAYLWVTRRVLFGRVAAPVAWFDRHVVDGAVNLSARSTEAASRGLARLQTGQLQAYGAWLVSGAAALALLLWRSRQ